MFARVKLLGGAQHDAVLINDSAVGTDQTVQYVLVVGADNKVEYRPVQLGAVVDGLRVVRTASPPARRSSSTACSACAPERRCRPAARRHG